MSMKHYYYGVVLIAVAAIVVIVMFSQEDEAVPDTPAAVENQLPPGHPDISEMEGNPGQGPSGANVRADFMKKLDEMKKRVDAAPADDTTDVLLLARMLFESHQLEKALPYFERYTKAVPSNLDAKIDLSVAYYELEKKDKAIATTNEVLKADPDNTVAQYNLGVIYLSMEDKARGTKVLNNLIEKYPHSADAQRAQQLLSSMEK